MASSPSAAAAAVNQPPPPPAAETHAVYVDQLYPQQSSNPPRRSSNPPRRVHPFIYLIAKWLLMTLLFLLLIVFVIELVIWVFYRPQLPEIFITEADISNLAITNTTATMECTVILLLKNTNLQFDAIYTRLKISLLYSSQEEVLLSQYNSYPFVLPKELKTYLEADLSFHGISLGGDVMKGMKEDMGKGNLSFGIKVVAVVSYNRGVWQTRRQIIEAYCGGLAYGVDMKRELSDPLMCNIDFMAT